MLGQNNSCPCIILSVPLSCRKKWSQSLKGGNGQQPPPLSAEQPCEHTPIPGRPKLALAVSPSHQCHGKDHKCSRLRQEAVLCRALWNPAANRINGKTLHWLPGTGVVVVLVGKQAGEGLKRWVQQALLSESAQPPPKPLPSPEKLQREQTITQRLPWAAGGSQSPGGPWVRGTRWSALLQRGRSSPGAGAGQCCQKTPQAPAWRVSAARAWSRKGVSACSDLDPLQRDSLDRATTGRGLRNNCAGFDS